MPWDKLHGINSGMFAGRRVNITTILSSGPVPIRPHRCPARARLGTAAAHGGARLPPGICLPGLLMLRAENSPSPAPVKSAPDEESSTRHRRHAACHPSTLWAPKLWLLAPIRAHPQAHQVIPASAALAAPPAAQPDPDKRRPEQQIRRSSEQQGVCRKPAPIQPQRELVLHLLLIPRCRSRTTLQTRRDSDPGNTPCS